MNCSCASDIYFSFLYTCIIYTMTVYGKHGLKYIVWVFKCWDYLKVESHAFSSVQEQRCVVIYYISIRVYWEIIYLDHSIYTILTWDMDIDHSVYTILTKMKVIQVWWSLTSYFSAYPTTALEIIISFTSNFIFFDYFIKISVYL